MPQVKLPFSAESKSDTHDDGLQQCGLLRMLAAPLQEACSKEPHLLQYLHIIPPEEIGTLQYHEKLSRKLQGLKPLNLIYPLGDDLFVHVYSNGEERASYISIEPSLFQDVSPIMMELEKKLLDYASDFAFTETDEERKQLFLGCIERICTTTAQPGKAKAKIPVTLAQLQAIKYLLVRDKVGLGVLEPILHDPNIEDISCSGIGHVFLEHKVFRSLKASVVFSDFEELDEFILRLAERIGRPVTIRNPVVDAVLPDGSRINIVYGREVSRRGSNFTIRKFSETPLSILELIEFGTLDYLMAAYLSIVLEDGMNCFVIGETASGKTTLLNAITTFIPPTAKIVSIEDTPELQVPQKNWLREVARATKTEGREAQVTMFELLKAALRQRPNVIIVGEIRGEEGATAFQAMQTGHAVMATFHAASVEKLIQRLTGNPINVPKTYMDNLNVVVIQSAVKLPDGKMGRRAVSISEIISYDPISQSFSFVEIFRWNSVTDAFEFVGNRNSYILEQKISPKRGLSARDKWKVYELLTRRARVLERLHKEMRIVNFYELLQVLSKAQQEGVF